jgi:hypothetical protein
MNINVMPEHLFFLVDIVLLILIAVIYFGIRKQDRKKAETVMQTNEVLATAVNSLVKTMNKSIEMNIIDRAVAERMEPMEPTGEPSVE